jgi:putative ABC transport system substrate-binding protein
VRLLTRLAVVLACVLAPLAAEAQPKGKVPRIAFLRSGPAPKAFTEAFQQGLREAGYVEGKNIVVEYRFGNGTTEQLSELVREIVSLHVDVIVASAAPAAFAARKATTTTPIVFAGVVDPIDVGLAASLARPGGNATGMSIISVDLLGKRLELLREILPKLSRLVLLWNPANPTHAVQLKHAQALAQSLGIEVQPVPVGTTADLDRGLGAAKGAQALLQLDDVFFTTHRERLIGLAMQARLPAIYGYREMAEAGGLMSYGANLPDLYRRAAAYVDKVLKGTPPRDLPIQQPTKFELVINLKSVKALGLTIPQPVLLRADEVIQ